MSRARHNIEAAKKMGKAEGGKVPLPYNAKGSPAEREAEEHKRGGAVKKKAMKDGGHVEGAAPKRHRLDRPGRKRGGAVGADMHPLSTAARVTNAVGHDANTGDAEED